METALYIHYPFCVQKCLYCDFNSVADSRIAPEEYIAAVVREMELRAERLSSPVTAPTLYFGGGTPSLLAPALVGKVVDTAARLYGLDSAAEITVEANPGTLTREKLDGYRSASVNRLSLGIQSFHDPLLARLGRIHSAEDASAAFAAAREAGFANIGIDLIHSLPGETPAMWQDDLRQATNLTPEHISAYALTVEEGTPFHSLEREGKLALPGEETAVMMFRRTAEFLQAAGYEHYEISNFARPGCRSRHNQVYWLRGEYLGFGAGAHSFLARPGWGVRWHNPDTPERYLGAILSGAPVEEERTPLSRTEAMAEFLFLGLRMLEGVEETRFAREFGCTIDEVYPGVVGKLCADNLLERRAGWLRLSTPGLMVANQVFVRFL
jgi:oxygen-independent coproporphyrinogen-3 oxidase